MNRRKKKPMPSNFSIVLTMLLLSLFGMLLNNDSAIAQHVQVTVRRPIVACTHRTIRVSDVAELTGGNPLVRQQLAALDLDEFTADRTTISVAADLIRYRAVLAGIEQKQFQILGNETKVQFSAPIDADKVIEQQLVQQLTETFQIPADAIELQLTTSLNETLQNAGLDLSTLTVSARFPAELPLGTRTIELQLTDGNGRIRQSSAALKIAVYRDLVMVKQNVSRGELLVEEKIERVRRPIDNSQIAFASFDQTVGKQASHDIQQFSLVKAQYVRDADRSVTPFDVTRNSVMTIVVQRGALSVTLKDARANDNGRIGDYLNFINPKSGETIRAKVIDGHTAVIEM